MSCFLQKSTGWESSNESAPQKGKHLLSNYKDITSMMSRLYPNDKIQVGGWPVLEGDQWKEKDW